MKARSSFPLSFTCLAALLLCLLSACEQLGIPDPAKEAEAKDAEGKAIGSACRHAGRALEDCYTMNPRAIKAAVFTGWRDMNDYMEQNKIDVVKPELAAVSNKRTEKAEEEESKPEPPAPKKNTVRKKMVGADSGAH